MTNLSGVLKSIRDIMRQDKGLNGDAQRIEQLGWMLFLKIFSDNDLEREMMNEKYRSPIPREFHWIKEKGNWAGDDEGMTGDELLAFVDEKLFPTLRNIDISIGNGRALIVREVFEGNNNYMKSGQLFRQVVNELNKIDGQISVQGGLPAPLFVIIIYCEKRILVFRRQVHSCNLFIVQKVKITDRKSVV